MEHKKEPTTNFEIINNWLVTTDLETVKLDLDLVKNILVNTGSLILFSIHYDPLEFANKISFKLLKLKEIVDLYVTDPLVQKDLDNELDQLLTKLDGFLIFLKIKTPDAIVKAKSLVDEFIRVDEARTNALYGLLTSSHKPDRALGFFIKDNTLAKSYSKFALGVGNAKLWELIKPLLPSFENYSTAYPNNQLALLFEPDNSIFLNSIIDGKLFLTGEVGALALQRIISEYSFFNLREKGKISNYLKLMSEELNHYDPETLLSELVKLQLYAEYCKINQLPLVAWIGSARPVFSMIKTKPGQGAYLNCDDDQWSAELNRTWLLAAFSLGYEIKLVEQHFPNIEKAILSGDITKYISALADEIRPSFKKMHSQYHGGDEPTATAQEILLLMSVGCKGTRNEDGSISLLPAQQPAEEYVKKSTTLPSMRRRRIHSIEHIKDASPQPVRNKLFQHPGKSEDIRSDSSSTTSEEEKKGSFDINYK